MESAIPSRSGLRERAQIAQSLRHQAIQPIFAVGIGLTALAASFDEPNVRRRLMGYVAALDEAVSAIYATVSDLALGESDADISAS